MPQDLVIFLSVTGLLALRTYQVNYNKLYAPKRGKKRKR